MRNRDIIHDIEKNIDLFVKLSEIIRTKNLFALDDASRRIPRYYRRLIDLILMGVHPDMIAHTIINDFTTLHLKKRNRKRFKQLIYWENVIGYGIYYLQECLSPEELSSKLREKVFYMHNRRILYRNFSDSYFKRFAV